MKRYTIGRRAAHTAGLCALWTIVVFSVESSTVQAATCTSNGTGGGAWSTPGAWQSGCTGTSGVPGSGDDVVILAGDIVTVDTAGVTVHSLNVSGTLNAGSQSTFTVASDTTIGSTGLLQAPSNRLYVGGNWGGTGLFTHNGGAVEFNGSAQQQITTARTGSTKRFNHVSVSGAGGLIAKFSVDATGNLAVASASGGLSAQGKWAFALTASKVMDCDGSCSFVDLEVRTVDASGSTGSRVWLTLLSRPRVDENKVIDITSSAIVVVAAVAGLRGSHWCGSSRTGMAWKWPCRFGIDDLWSS